MTMQTLDPEMQREFAVQVVRELRDRGFTAYWAGGCVRDQLLGRTPKDYDVATNATPMQIRDVLRRRKTLSMGAAFGVITVLGPRGAGQIEVATFRQDAGYSDGRHPDSVSFSTPEADAQRRDFTINGLFFDPVTAEVIDYVGGREDLARGLLRAIGDAHHRFAEDKLRMLRAVRFAALFGFALDAATGDAIRSMADQVTVVSVERISAEVELMLTRPQRRGAVELLSAVGLLDVILPEVNTSDARWPWTLGVLDRLEDPSFSLALAALLQRYADRAAVEAICRRWKLSNHEIKRSTWLVEYRSALIGASTARWPRLQRILIAEGASELVALHAAAAQLPSEIDPAEPRATQADLDFCRERMALPAEELNPPPILTGDDLIKYGVPRGKIYQTLLDEVRDAQLEGAVKTRAEALALVDRIRSA